MGLDSLGGHRPMARLVWACGDDDRRDPTSAVGLSGPVSARRRHGVGHLGWIRPPRRRARPAQGDAGRLRRRTANQKATRAYHFGSQGAGDVFSNHTSHSNRLVPVYLFGRKADLKSVDGREQPLPRRREAQGDLRLPAREHASTPAPTTPTRATSTGCRRRPSPGASSTSSSSGSTAWTGRPRRPRRSPRRARSTPRARARA